MVDLKRALLGYSTSSVEAVLAERERLYERVATDARSAEERAERLSAQLSDVEVRMREAEEQLRAERESVRTRGLELDRAIAERDAARAQLVLLHQEVLETKGTIDFLESALSDREGDLRTGADRIAALEGELAERTRERDDLATRSDDAGRGTAELRQSLYERSQLLASAQDEASKAKVWLRRALEESAEYKQALSTAEARVAELEDVIATYRGQLEERVTTSVEQTAVPAGGPSSAGELASVLRVTEEAVVRIMESTRARADRELRNIELDRERIGREVEAMIVWRDRAAPMIASLEATMNELTGQVSEIGVRVNEVLRPFTGAVTRLSSQLASLDGLPQTLPPPPEDASESSPGARIIELREDQSAARDRWRDG